MTSAFKEILYKLWKNSGLFSYPFFTEGLPRFDSREAFFFAMIKPL